MAHQLRMFVLQTLIALCVGVFLLETAGAGPVAPVPVKNTGVSKSMVVIFPIRKDNVFDCGAELLRQINQYCIVNFDMRGIDMSIPSGNVQQLGPDGKPAPKLSELRTAHPFQVLRSTLVFGADPRAIVFTCFSPPCRSVHGAPVDKSLEEAHPGQVLPHGLHSQRRKYYPFILRGFRGSSRPFTHNPKSVCPKINTTCGLFSSDV